MKIFFKIILAGLLSFFYLDTFGQKFVSVTDFGANGNDTLEDTRAFRDAINYAACYLENVYVPNGNYYIGDVKLKSGIKIFGEGEASVINKIHGAFYALGCNFSYPDTGDPSGKKNINNIIVSNLTFIGTSTTDGFAEHKHLLNLNGVEHVKIDSCKFYGFNGDAIYIGSGVAVEKHNRNVFVSNCHFDGINKQNRNAISVIDCDSLSINNNKFYNCSRSDMPGAIDLEPDAYPFHIIRNIEISDNYFYNIGGGVAAISVYLPVSQRELLNPVKNISILKNKLENVENGIGVFHKNEAVSGNFEHNLIVDSNRVTNSNGYPLGIFGISKVRVSNNIFESFKTNVFLGLPPAKFGVYDASFINNTFRDNSGDGVAVSLRSVEIFISRANTFENIGLKNGKYGIAILGETKGRTRSVQSINDVVLGDKTTAFSAENPGHDTDAAKNIFEKGKIGNKQVNYFRFNKR